MDSYDLNSRSTDLLPGTINILSNKIYTTTSTRSIADQYGLWFNAQYQYDASGFNVVTGDEISKSSTIITRPATPIFYNQTSDILTIFI
mgnify:CR=1 FL=1